MSSNINIHHQPLSENTLSLSDCDGGLGEGPRVDVKVTSATVGLCTVIGVQVCVRERSGPANYLG